MLDIFVDDIPFIVNGREINNMSVVKDMYRSIALI